jgi:hypothetical protein
MPVSSNFLAGTAKQQYLILDGYFKTRMLGKICAQNDENF